MMIIMLWYKISEEKGEVGVEKGVTLEVEDQQKSV